MVVYLGSHQGRKLAFRKSLIFVKSLTRHLLSAVDAPLPEAETASAEKDAV